VADFSQPLIECGLVLIALKLAREFFESFDLAIVHGRTIHERKDLSRG